MAFFGNVKADLWGILKCASFGQNGNYQSLNIWQIKRYSFAQGLTCAEVAFCARLCNFMYEKNTKFHFKKFKKCLKKSEIPLEFAKFRVNAP